MFMHAEPKFATRLMLSRTPRIGSNGTTDPILAQPFKLARLA